MDEQFHRPGTVPEAHRLKRRFAGRSAYLAGGTLANAKDTRLHADHWISLAGLKLDRIDERRGNLVLGALCTFQRVIDDERTPEPLRSAVAQVVNRNIRNAATIGGHVAANLPYSDLLPMLVALEALVELRGPRAVRMLPIFDYLGSAVASVRNGLVAAVVIPRTGRGRPAACGNLRGSANARSLLSAAASLARPGSGIQDPVLALSGATGRVVRLTAVEEALNGRPLPPVDQLEAMISRSVKPAATPLAGAPYLKHQAGVLVARVLRAAVELEGERG